MSSMPKGSLCPAPPGELHQPLVNAITKVLINMRVCADLTSGVLCCGSFFSLPNPRTEPLAQVFVLMWLRMKHVVWNFQNFKRVRSKQAKPGCGILSHFPHRTMTSWKAKVFGPLFVCPPQLKYHEVPVWIMEKVVRQATPSYETYFWLCEAQTPAASERPPPFLSKAHMFFFFRKGLRLSDWDVFSSPRDSSATVSARGVTARLFVGGVI